MDATLQAALSVYAAIVSTVTAGWGLYVGFRDRANLSLKVTLAVIPRLSGYAQPQLPPGWAGPGDWTVFFTVANRGRRPVTASLIGFDIQGFDLQSFDQEMVIAMIGLPKELTEGQTLELPVRLKEVRNGFSQIVGNYYPTRAWVKDNLGRKRYATLPHNVLDAALARGQGATLVLD